MVDVNGVRTHYQRIPAKSSAVGAPPTVVFVHGLGYDSLASFYLTLAAPVADAGVDVLTYDLRAHGRTGRPSTGYRVSDFVADLAELLDVLRVAHPVHLAGNSFGGTIAFSFAAAYPARVASIVSIESEPATESWADRMGRTFANVLGELDDDANLAWLTETFGPHYARLSRSAAAIIRATSIVDDVPSGPLLGEVGLRAIRCPVLSIVGSDGFQRDDPYALQSVLPHCRTEVVPDQGHSVLVERHRLVKDLVLGWVAEHEGVPREDARSWVGCCS